MTQTLERNSLQSELESGGLRQKEKVFSARDPVHQKMARTAQPRSFSNDKQSKNVL